MASPPRTTYNLRDEEALVVAAFLNEYERGQAIDVPVDVRVIIARFLAELHLSAKFSRTVKGSDIMLTEDDTECRKKGSDNQDHTVIIDTHCRDMAQFQKYCFTLTMTECPGKFERVHSFKSNCVFGFIGNHENSKVSSSITPKYKLSKFGLGDNKNGVISRGYCWYNLRTSLYRIDSSTRRPHSRIRRSCLDAVSFEAGGKFKVEVNVQKKSVRMSYFNPFSDKELVLGTDRIDPTKCIPAVSMRRTGTTLLLSDWNIEAKRASEDNRAATHLAMLTDDYERSL